MNEDLKNLARDTAYDISKMEHAIDMRNAIESAFRQVGEMCANECYEKVVPERLGEDEMNTAGVVLYCVDAIRALFTEGATK